MSLAALLPTQLRVRLLALEENTRTVRLFLTAPRQPLCRVTFAPLPEPRPHLTPPEPVASRAVAASGARHRVRYLASAVELEVAEGQTLLQAGLDAGLALRSACRRGLCGTCKSRLVSGAVEMRQPNVLSDEERARGYCLPCVSSPRGPLTIDA